MSTETTLRLLENIRRLDSIIDFSRATLQLKTILILSISSKGLSAEEIANKTGFRKKTVLDTLRKLEEKGLVVRRNEIFFLSDLGMKYLEQLRKLLKISVIEKGEERELKEFASKIVFYGALRDLILVLGQRNGLTLEKISILLSASPRKVKNYIIYINSVTNSRLIKRVRKKRLFGTKYVYVLTTRGRNLYNIIASMGSKGKYNEPLSLLPKNPQKLIQYNVAGVVLSSLLFLISPIYSFIVLLMLIMAITVIIHLKW